MDPRQVRSLGGITHVEGAAQHTINGTLNRKQHKGSFSFRLVKWNFVFPIDQGRILGRPIRCEEGREDHAHFEPLAAIRQC